MELGNTSLVSRCLENGLGRSEGILGIIFCVTLVLHCIETVALLHRHHCIETVAAVAQLFLLPKHEIRAERLKLSFISWLFLCEEKKR